MKTNQKRLGDLLDSLTDCLIERIEDGLASSADLGVAVTLLKNNNVTVSAETNSAMNDLEKALNEIKRGVRKASEMDKEEMRSKMTLGAGSGE